MQPLRPGPQFMGRGSPDAYFLCDSRERIGEFSLSSVLLNLQLTHYAKMRRQCSEEGDLVLPFH